MRAFDLIVNQTTNAIESVVKWCGIMSHDIDSVGGDCPIHSRVCLCPRRQLTGPAWGCYRRDTGEKTADRLRP